MSPNLPDPITLLTVLIILGMAPFAAILVTSFTKIVIVLSLLRLALGVQQVPPNLVLNGIALILSAYIMAPIGMTAIEALQRTSLGGKNNQVDQMISVAEVVKGPLKEFLNKNITEREKLFFLKSAKSIWPPERAAQLKEDDLMILVPSFTVSELTKAFQIGFVIYLAFVAVDLIIANILLAMGMSMISPTMISVPFKLLLFVVLDGWSQLIHSLVLSYK
ncbi:MAG: type III secretion system export apparatus subunit SctR [Burkholderiales bacterium]|jgi:type III secretion protein R|nr:type III secretion system export apparatus subunit SctR [Burkholderiales bacterium]